MKVRRATRLIVFGETHLILQHMIDPQLPGGTSVNAQEPQIDGRVGG